MMTVGERIRKRRIELGLSQDELSEKMGYHGRSTICKAETCGDNITTEKVKKYAKYLDCSFEYLMGWDMEKVDISTPELDAKISNDKELKEIIKIYYNLSSGKQKQVRDFIKFINKGE